jgi:hypothetical protein
MSPRLAEIASAIENEFPILSFEHGRIDKISFDDVEEVEREWIGYDYLREQMSMFVKRRFSGRAASVARLICQVHAGRIREKIIAAELEYACRRELVSQLTTVFPQFHVPLM